MNEYESKLLRRMTSENAAHTERQAREAEITTQRALEFVEAMSELGAPGIELYRGDRAPDNNSELIGRGWYVASPYVTGPDHDCVNAGIFVVESGEVYEVSNYRGYAGIIDRETLDGYRNNEEKVSYKFVTRDEDAFRDDQYIPGPQRLTCAVQAYMSGRKP